MGLHISDINKRQRITESASPVFCNVNKMMLFTESGKLIKENALYLLEHWDSLSKVDSCTSFLMALDVFDAVCESSFSNGELDACFHILYEGVNKVRDATQLLNSIKHRTSRFKTKISTKINNSIDAINGANTATINNITNKLGSAIKSASATPIPQQDSSGVAKQEAYYEQLTSRLQELSECDRIIRNYTKISKRFNFDRMVNEVYNEDFIYSCIIEMCRCIDTYNTSLLAKYQISLENTYYVLNKNHMNCSKRYIVETVTDYFTIEKSISVEELNELSTYMKHHSLLFNEANFISIDDLTNKDVLKAKNDIGAVVPDPSTYGIDFFTLNEGNLKEKAKQKMKQLNTSTEKEAEETKQMLDEFRKACMGMEDKEDKNALNSKLSKLKDIIRKIYTKNPEQIATGLPNILTTIRVFFVLSPMSINPILSILSFIVDQAIKFTVERKNIDKMLKAYEKEISLVTTKINNTTSQDEKNNLQKYLDELKKDQKKIKEYDDNLYSEEENEKRHEDDYEFDDGFDFDFDDDEFDDFDDGDFEESQLIQASSILLISEMVSSIQESLLDVDVDGLVYSNIFKFDNDTLDTLADFSITVPVILEKKALKEAMEEYRKQLREQKSKDINDFIRIDCLTQNIYKLENSTNVYNISNDVKSLICTLNCLNELSTFATSEYLIEMDLTNSLKLAMNRLKKTAIKLDTKQKQISNTIDVSMRNVSKGIENSMMNDNREAVIRGSILPSASKTIKLAITTGFAWALNPAIAVIGALGAFACSKKLKAKERQLVLDDIEIELKMCERYLRQAEDKNDMKAIRQIETTQRSLLRQQQRIKYKMNVVYKQNVPDVKPSDD